VDREAGDVDLTRLSADRDIARVLAEYCHYCDDGDFDALLDRFTDDAEFLFAGRAVHGRDELRAWFDKTQSPPRRGKHVTANTIIEVDGDRAVAVSDYAFLTKVEGRLVPLITGRYRDELTRSGGRWQISRRDASMM
jgi:uncharacterized protein (TIGR02246 family)